MNTNPNHDKAMKQNIPTESPKHVAKQETGEGCSGATCSASSTCEKITVIGGILFVTCIPAAFFFIHPAVGFFVTGAMGFLCSKSAIEAAKKDSDNSKPNDKMDNGE